MKTPFKIIPNYDMISGSHPKIEVPIPNFDIVEGGYFTYEFVDWRNPAEIERLNAFVEKGLEKCFSKGKDIKLKFRQKGKSDQFVFQFQTGYRAKVGHADTHIYDMVVESIPDHEVVSAIIYHPRNDAVLFVQRSFSDPLWPGKWYFISEHIEGRPTWELGILEKTAKRGAMDEVSLDVGIKGVLRPYSIFHQNERFRIWPVVCKAYSDDVNRNHEINDYKWIKPSKVRLKLDPMEIIEGGGSLGDDGHTLDDVLREVDAGVCGGVLFAQFNKRAGPAILKLANSRQLDLSDVNDILPNAFPTISFKSNH